MMKLDCKNCGAMCGHWMVVEVPEESKYKCVCRQCGAIWFANHHPLKDDKSGVQVHHIESETAESFGITSPPENYYMHRGHTWAAMEDSGEVRVGLDDFSQKILGTANEIKIPTTGMIIYQDHVCMAVIKDEKKASFEAPIDGMITAVNTKVLENPRLLHDDPYGQGWLFKVKPTNLQRNLDNLFTGDKNVIYMGHESHRLLNLMETTAGVTLPSGGAIIDDVCSHCPQIGFRRLAKEFFLTSVSRNWKKR